VIRPGLCSVTFRSLEIEEIVRLAADAGLECIEWAGDVHVPPGDSAAARHAARATEQAGLAVASYGSYLRFEGEDPEFESEASGVLASAIALGAPRIRVWAGGAGSDETDGVHRALITRRIREFSDRAQEHGIEIGLEFHGGTLTDTIDSTMRLLHEIARAGVRSYWQPPQDMEEPEAIDTLRTVLGSASTIHVFSWWPNHQRHPLSARADLWREVFGVLAAEGSARDALLEFVPDDDPGILTHEAEALRTLIADGQEAVR
jgi:3-dehydroshikimate dehydratase